jgi:hypothetical protein
VVTIRGRIESVTNRVSTRTWGAALEYQPVGGGTLTETPAGEELRGVFDSAFVVTVEIDGLEVTDRRPMLNVERNNLLVEPARGDVFTLLDGPHAGEVYTVTEARADAAQGFQLWCVKGTHQ